MLVVLQRDWTSPRSLLWQRCDRRWFYIRSPSIFKVVAGAVRPSAMCGCCRRCSWSWLDWLSHLQLFVPSTHLALFAFAKLQFPMIVWFLFADVCCAADTVPKVCKRAAVLTTPHDFRIPNLFRFSEAPLQVLCYTPLWFHSGDGLCWPPWPADKNLVCFQSARMSGPKPLRNVWHRFGSSVNLQACWCLGSVGLWFVARRFRVWQKLWRQLLALQEPSLSVPSIDFPCTDFPVRPSTIPKLLSDMRPQYTPNQTCFLVCLIFQQWIIWRACIQQYVVHSRYAAVELQKLCWQRSNLPST